MSKKPCSISFRSVGKNKPCTTVINGDLKVKGDLITNGSNNGGSSRVYLNPESVDEDNKTYSLDTTLSFVTYDGPDGQGNIPDGKNSDNGLLKYVIDLVNRVDCLGDCINGNINTIAYDNGGNGPYIGGEFKNAGRVEGLNYLAKWGGSSVGWTSVDSSGDNVNNTVYAIEFDSSNNVYIGGSFTSVSGNTVLKKLAKYDGGWGVINTSNSTPDDKISGNAVYTISFDNSNEIYIGGDFSMDTGPPFFASYNNIAKWDGSSVEWSAIKVNPVTFDSILGGSVLTVKAITSSEIYIGGEFTSVDTPPNTNLQYLAKWNGSSWTSINGVNDGVDNTVRIINVINSNELYIGGDFKEIDSNTILKHLAKWNGGNWDVLDFINGDDIVNNTVYTIAFDNNNVGPYIGGSFTSVSGNNVLKKLAKWNGGNWASVNGGGGDIDDTVRTIAIDSNDNVTIGGQFTEPLEYLAITDQTTGWTSIDNLDNNLYTITYNGDETADLTGLSNNSYLKLIWSSSLNKWVQVI